MPPPRAQWRGVGGRRCGVPRMEAKLEQLDQAHAVGALTEEQFLAAKGKLVEVVGDQQPVMAVEPPVAAVEAPPPAAPIASADGVAPKTQNEAAGGGVLIAMERKEEDGNEEDAEALPASPAPPSASAMAAPHVHVTPAAEAATGQAETAKQRAEGSMTALPPSSSRWMPLPLPITCSLPLHRHHRGATADHV